MASSAFLSYRLKLEKVMDNLNTVADRAVEEVLEVGKVNVQNRDCYIIPVKTFDEIMSLIKNTGFNGDGYD